jgi:iron(III) transport system ATP-binding protein
MPDLVVENLAVRLGGLEILKSVSFTARPGEIIALLGPSGSGKTTLLRCVAGLERPYQGKITIGERTLLDAGRGIELAAEQRGLGLVFQSYALWPHKTVFENVAYPLRLRRVSGDEIKRRVNEALTRLGLGHLGQRFPHQLSGGQQQRVAIARAFVYEPPVILLDEPLSNLDAKLRDEARAWLRTLIRDLGLAALCVTHDQVEAMALADRILLLNGGAVEQEGRPNDLYAAPRTLFAAEFMGINNRLDGKLEGVADGRARLRIEDVTLEGQPQHDDLVTGGSAIGVIRVERVHLVNRPGPNRVVMQLETAMYLGERYELSLRRGEWHARALVAEPSGAQELLIEFPREALWVFTEAGALGPSLRRGDNAHDRPLAS